tara:strand:- start:174 stop:1337 length:1164 start_codon:yes stop_codon:yes gene_type:complete
MGLLTDTYSDILKKLQGIDNRADDDFSAMDSDFNTSGAGIKASLRDRKDGSPLTKEGGAIFPTSIFPQNQGQIKLGNNTINLPKSVLTKEAAANQAKAIKNNKIPVQDATKTEVPDMIKTGTGSKYATDGNFLNKIADLANIDLDQAKKQWSDKGGFNGLMANPAFTLGLAFMQAGARGEKLGQNLLDNVLKSSAISEQYKKKLADKTEIMEVTAGDMNQIKNVLSSFNISAPFFRKLLPGKQAEMYEQAVEDIAFAVQKKVRAKVKKAKEGGKDLQVGTRLYKETIKEMIDAGEIDQKGGLKLFGYSIFDSTLEAKAEGGPINAGQAYLVGEKGPEIVIPHSSGNVVANDDSQVFNMLLASNPQLQRVSKERAMKILKAKFPEYFD